MTQYGARGVADSVHGTIGLSDLEMELISTQAFQRLRNVKQLGLASLVFPGANYSRFSHSLGVCHVTGRILDSLNAYSQADIEEEEYRNYRLAGMLHDIGHFPFSHAFENVVSSFYKDRQAEHSFDDSDSPTRGGETEQNLQNAYSLHHEEVGRLLLERDEEIIKVLQNQNIQPYEIHRIFTREEPPRFANLISSDLDADRIDYLLRTAKHTGLPYGIVDIDYLISQMRLDRERRICLTPKALRTAEHLLLGRYFDYQQVSFHKTVAAFEWILKDVTAALLADGRLDCSVSGIERMIENGEWYHFDDPYVLTMIRDLESESNGDDGVLEAKIKSLLRRSPPKLIGGIECWADRNESLASHKTDIDQLNDLVANLSSEFDIHRDMWYVWDNGGMSLTNVGPYLPIEGESIDQDELGQSIRIKYGDDSKLIFDDSTSLMKVLSRQTLYTARLYVILPEELEQKRSEITEYARNHIYSQFWFDGK